MGMRLGSDCAQQPLALYVEYCKLHRQPGRRCGRACPARRDAVRPGLLSAQQLLSTAAENDRTRVDWTALGLTGGPVEPRGTSLDRCLGLDRSRSSASTCERDRARLGSCRSEAQIPRACWEVHGPKRARSAQRTRNRGTTWRSWTGRVSSWLRPSRRSSPLGTSPEVPAIRATRPRRTSLSPSVRTRAAPAATTGPPSWRARPRRRPASRSPRWPVVRAGVSSRVRTGRAHHRTSREAEEADRQGETGAVQRLNPPRGSRIVVVSLISWRVRKTVHVVFGTGGAG
jgi:hypothetical protein